MKQISLSYKLFQLQKRVALMISRGNSAGSSSFIVELEYDGIVGIGEAAEYDIPGHEEDVNILAADLAKATSLIAPYHPAQRDEIERAFKAAGVGNSVRCAIDMALWDWLGKSTQLPVWKLLGLAPKARGPVSVTIGINTPDGAQERLRKWLELGRIRGIKVKLGSPQGVDADKAMLSAVREIAPTDAYIGIDANCGWTLENAVAMSRWLKDQGVEHMEQPLPIEQNHLLEDLYRQTALPIFIDESCTGASDIVKLGRYIHGINIKITKVGGLSEALRMIATAQAFGLETMVGCYGNIALGNGAAHQLASLIDYIDLDSHLNIANDPTIGHPFEDGFLINQNSPGLGVRYA